MKIEIDKITVKDRTRKEFKNIPQLANSIKEYGLLQPLVVDKQFNLIAGERRLRACQELGLQEVEVIFVDEIEEWRKKAMELEENLQRENLTYPEEVAGKLLIHELYQAKFGVTMETNPLGWELRAKDGWTMLDTAVLLGESEGCTVQDIQLAKAIQLNPELAKKEGKSAAIKAMRNMEETRIRSIVAKVLAEESKTGGEESVQIRLGDSIKVLKEYQDDSFDFCITDPPYAVEIDTSTDLKRQWDGLLYEDEGNIQVQEQVFREVYRVLREGSHCYVFFASKNYTMFYRMLIGIGFRVSPIPLIWVKNVASTYDPYRSYSSAYEPIFYCSKGKPKPISKLGRGDVFDYSSVTSSKKIHPTEKPLPLILELVELCSVEHELGLDPFLGSGVTAVACRDLNRRCIGIEKGEVFYTRAVERLKEKGDSESV